MKTTVAKKAIATALAFTVVLETTLVRAVEPPVQPVSPASLATVAYEVLPTLSATAILQPQYLRGPNFIVRDAVTPAAGANYFTIDSDYGVFEAEGNTILTRRVAEINAIAKLRTMSGTKEFAQGVERAANVSLNAAKDLVNDPVAVISTVPKGIRGFLNRTQQSIKETRQGRKSSAAEGSALENMVGYTKAKRNLAIELGVDPYSSDPVFQNELAKVARAAFAGTFTVNLGMSAVSGGAGIALSAVNVTATLSDVLRNKSPSDLRRMNLALLKGIGVSEPVADAFLNNSALSPTAQTIIVDALSQLGRIPGQTEYIEEATGSEDEHDALAFQQSAQMMAQVNAATPVARITDLSGLPVCQTKEGAVVIPIQWDYIAWTALAEKFANALKARPFATPATSYTLMLTGVVSPTAARKLTELGVSIIPKALPGPLQ